MTRALFKQYDDQIDYFKRFPDEALALAEIRERQLWRHAGLNSFKDYLKSKPRRIKESYASMLIRAAILARRWPDLHFPNEGSVRPLVQLSLHNELRAIEIIRKAMHHYRTPPTTEMSKLVAAMVVKDDEAEWPDFREFYDALKRSRKGSRVVHVSGTFLGGRSKDNRFVFEGEAVPNLAIGTKVRLAIYVVEPDPFATEGSDEA